VSIGSRLKHAWNTFFSEETDGRGSPYPIGPSTSTRPDRPRFRFFSERTIIASIYTRLSIDVSGIRIEHVRVNDEGQYVETIKSGLNNCLTVEANLDQGARHFRQDMPLTMFQEGCIAIVPVDTTLDPLSSGNWDVKTMRVGTILQWYPQQVRVRAYNEKKGIYEELILPKSMVAIVENPFYAVMNEPNSTLQRLVHKLGLLDNVDEISSSGKLDIIIQLPYVVKSEARKNQAETRRKELESQLQGSTYGIAYADGTEKITQLNRAVENNLLEQVKYLKEELYNELGLTPEIMNGTADDVAMLNYMNRTIEPIMDAITEAIARTFLTKTARTQGQTMMYFQTPFKLIPISKFGELTDVLSRNQIVTPNEIRPVLGLKPSKQPQADQLVNSNMPIDKQISGQDTATPEEPVDQAASDEAKLNDMMSELGV
jgi:Phage portal protein